MAEHDEPTPGTHDDDMRDDVALETEPDADASADDDAGGSDSDDASEQDELAKTKAELERERNARKQLLSEKSTWERTRADSESGQPKPPTGEADNGESKARQRLMRDIALVEKLADDSQELTEKEAVEALRAQARLQRAQHNMLMEQAGETALQKSLSKAERQEDRTEAEKLVRSGRVSDVDTALELVQTKRRLAELEAGAKRKDPKDEEAEAKDILKRSAPQVGQRGMGSGETGARIKESTYQSRLASFDSSDPEQFEKKRAFAAKYNGKVIPGQ